MLYFSLKGGHGKSYKQSVCVERVELGVQVPRVHSLFFYGLRTWWLLGLQPKATVQIRFDGQKEVQFLSSPLYDQVAELVDAQRL